MNQCYNKHIKENGQTQVEQFSYVPQDIKEQKLHFTIIINLTTSNACKLLYEKSKTSKQHFQYRHALL